MNKHIARFLPSIAVAVFLVLSIPRIVAQSPIDRAMTQNKVTVQAYMDAFRKSDHAAILSCLTDDVEWIVPGAFRATGKAEFDKQIENDAFVAHPIIEVSRMTEEQNVVVAEGTVRTTRQDGGVLNLVFCDVFEMRGTKIERLTSYLMEIKGTPDK